MSQRGLVLTVVALLLLLVGILWLVRPSDDAAVDATAVVEQDAFVEGGHPVRLFFPGGDGLLHMEERAVTVDPQEDRRGDSPEIAVAESLPPGRVALAAAVVRAVLEAPEQEGLRRSFDKGTALADVRLTTGGIAIVSLQPAPGSVNRGLGSRAELLRVYSLVDSVVYSVPGVESVMILWAGSQPSTLAGHVDTSRPLFSSLDWVARESRDALEATRSIAATAESQ